MRSMSLYFLLISGCAVGTVKSGVEDSNGDGITTGTIDSGDTGSTGTTTPEDLDNDGFFSDEDCDDTDPTIHPDADELCGDGVDNDCSGTADGGCPESLADATASLLGERTGDRAGGSLALAGDVNGDGNPDLLVGAREYSSGGDQLGRAYVVFGPLPAEARVLTDLPGVAIEGVQAGGGTGKVVAGLGDLDGDGLDEVMVTSDVADTDRFDNTGMLHVFEGATLASGAAVLDVDDATTTWSGRSAYSWLGVGVTAAPDLDGDGIRDVWVGASNDRAGAPGGGTVFLLSGADLMDVDTDPDLGAAIAEINGTEEDAYVGAAHAVPGDLDGDGVDDFVLGIYLSAANGDSSGKVAVFSGDVTGTLTEADAGTTWTGDSGDRLGCAISTAGDRNNDGYVDLWIGADRVDVSNADAGAAFLVLGGPSLAERSGSMSSAWDARLLGASAGQGLGNTLDGALDVDGDGNNDLVLGTPQAGLNVEGSVSLVVGAVEGTEDIGDRADRVWQGVNPEDRAGWRTRFGGDLLGTGQATVVLSAWESDRSGQDAGEVYILGL